MKRLLRKLIVAAGIVLLLLAGGLWWWHSRGGAKLSFTTATVKRGDIAATIGATGTIEPLEVVDVGAQVAGRVSAFGMGQGRQNCGLRFGGRARRVARED